MMNLSHDRKCLFVGLFVSPFVRTVVAFLVGGPWGFAGSLESARSQFSSELSGTARAANARNQALQKQYEQGLADHFTKGTPIPTQPVDQMYDNDRQFQASRTQIENSLAKKQSEARAEIKKETATKLLGRPLSIDRKAPKTAAERKAEKKRSAEIRTKAKRLSARDAQLVKKAVEAGVGLSASGTATAADGKDGKASDKDRSPAGAGGRPSYINTSGPARDTIVLDGSAVPKEIEFSGPSSNSGNPPAGPAPVKSH